MLGERTARLLRSAPLSRGRATLAGRLLGTADFQRQRWKNGKGETTEMAVAFASPDDSDFAWRISRASVCEDGPFSCFEGVDRCLTVLPGKGASLGLSHAGESSVLTPLEPFCFPGDVPTEGTLSSGAVDDFNVMTRRTRASAHTSIFGCEAQGATAATPEGFPDVSLFYCVGGVAHVATADREAGWQVREGELLWLLHPRPAGKRSAGRPAISCTTEESAAGDPGAERAVGIRVDLWEWWRD